jgi:hypothetical protein
MYSIKYIKIDKLFESYDNIWQQESTIFDYVLAYQEPLYDGLTYKKDAHIEKTINIKLLIEKRIHSHGKEYDHPYAYLDISQFIDNLDGLINALIESPAIYAGLKSKTQETYKTEQNKAMEDLCLTGISIDSIAQEMYSSPDGKQEINTDFDKAIRNYKRYYVQRLTMAWLKALGDLGNKKVVFLLDEFDIYIKREDIWNVELLWSIFERLHNKLPNFRLVLAGCTPPFHPNELVAARS